MGKSALDHCAELAASKKQEEAMKKEKKIVTLNKLISDAAVVHLKPIEQWVAADYRIMLKYKKKEGDPELAPKLKDLKEQWMAQQNNPSPQKNLMPRLMGDERETIIEDDDDNTVNVSILASNNNNYESEEEQ